MIGIVLLTGATGFVMSVLARQWLDLVLRNPGAYLAMRAELFCVATTRLAFVMMPLSSVS